MGFAFNLIFFTAQNEYLTLGLILGAPAVPALMLLVSLWFCPESPRYVRPPVFILPSFFIRLILQTFLEKAAINTESIVHEEGHCSL